MVTQESSAFVFTTPGSATSTSGSPDDASAVTPTTVSTTSTSGNPDDTPAVTPTAVSTTSTSDDPDDTPAVTPAAVSTTSTSDDPDDTPAVTPTAGSAGDAAVADGGSLWVRVAPDAVPLEMYSNAPSNTANSPTASKWRCNMGGR